MRSQFEDRAVRRRTKHRRGGEEEKRVVGGGKEQRRREGEKVRRMDLSVAEIRSGRDGEARGLAVANALARAATKFVLGHFEGPCGPLRTSEGRPGGPTAHRVSCSAWNRKKKFFGTLKFFRFFLEISIFGPL